MIYSYLVYTIVPLSFSPGCSCTEKPKSDSLMCPWSSRRMFSGFRSRWTMLREWRYCTASSRARIILLVRKEKKFCKVLQVVMFYFSNYHFSKPAEVGLICSSHWFQIILTGSEANLESDWVWQSLFYLQFFYMQEATEHNLAHECLHLMLVTCSYTVQVNFHTAII